MRKCDPGRIMPAPERRGEHVTSASDTASVVPARARSALTRRRADAAGLLAMQQFAGNRAVARQRAAAGRTRLLPADHASEREAESLAAAVQRGEPARHVATPGAATTGGQLLPASLDARLSAARGAGRPLPTALRSGMESTLGASLGRVRVHDGAQADGLSRSLRARAFTAGSDIFFRRGAYAPDTAAGTRLLAHELSHVVQQHHAATTVVQRYAEVVPGDPNALMEVDVGDASFEHQARGGQYKDFLASVDSPEQAELVTRTRTGADGLTLRISEHGELAVEHLGDGQEAKAYFATEAKITESNTALESVDSVYRMIAQDQSITVQIGGAGKRLQKVFPRNMFTVKDPQQAFRDATALQLESTEGLDMLGLQQCIQIATQLAGGQKANSLYGVFRQAAFNGPDLSAVAQVISTGRLRGVKGSAGALKLEYTNLLADLPDMVVPQDADGEAFTDLAELARELRDRLQDGKEPSAELGQECDDLLNADPDQAVALLPASVLVAQTPQHQDSLTRGLKAFVQTAQQYGAYRKLKTDEAARDALAQGLGIDEFAEPEIGQAFKITNLELTEPAANANAVVPAVPAVHEWNYHFAGVVARDGSDRITLENYTRDQQAKVHRDARWYFQMYGPGGQSFHHAWQTPDRVSYTSVQGKARVQPAPDSSTVHERLSAAEAALRASSPNRRHSQAFRQISEKLAACLELAAEDLDDQARKQLDTMIQEVINLIPSAASSKRNVQIRNARNLALGTLRTQLLGIADMLLTGDG